LSGLQEIVVILIIILILFILPRMMTGKQALQNRQTAVIKKSLFSLSGGMRLAVVVSILWPLTAAIWYRPWQKDMMLFICLGVGPVIVGWCLFWVVDGFRKKGSKARHPRFKV
jgi:hypothetical protein